MTASNNIQNLGAAMEAIYDDIRGSLNTGDLVFFAGKSLFSSAIKLGTLCKWSHVGMVLNIPEYQFLAVWESTPVGDIKDLISNTPKKGVQLVPLSDRVQKYSGSVAVRRLQGGSLGDGALDRLMGLRLKLRNRAYEQEKIELLKAAYDGPLGANREDLSSVFCSELVAEAYQALALLPEDKPSNEYTPADFSQGRMRDLARGFSLSKEITLKFSR